MYASTIQNVGEFHVPHKFVEHRCQDLIKRQQRVLYRIEQIEKEEKRDTTSQTSGTVDEFQVFKVLEKLSTTIVRAMNDLEHEVPSRTNAAFLKRTFLGGYEEGNVLGGGISKTW